MRQLYVALTRAKVQLYVPAALHYPSDKMKYGEASQLICCLRACISLPPIMQSFTNALEILRTRYSSILSKKSGIEIG